MNKQNEQQAVATPLEEARYKLDQAATRLSIVALLLLAIDAFHPLLHVLIIIVLAVTLPLICLSVMYTTLEKVRHKR